MSENRNDEDNRSLEGRDGSVTGALGALVEVLLQRGRVEARRVATSSRVRMELRQIRRDRDVMYQKLGREVRALIDGGEIQHPGLLRGLERIEELEERLRDAEDQVTDTLREE